MTAWQRFGNGARDEPPLPATAIGAANSRWSVVSSKDEGSDGVGPANGPPWQLPADSTILNVAWSDGQVHNQDGLSVWLRIVLSMNPTCVGSASRVGVTTNGGGG